jgi:hypothetical protein
MELQKKGKFIADFYGSSPALGAAGILKKWIADTQNKWLLAYCDQVKKKGQSSIEALESIMSIFHRDVDGNPILGNWMLRKCLINTGLAIFNAQKDKTHPKKSIIPMAIQSVTPLHINVENGRKIVKPNGVKTYTVTTTKGATTKSFFKAYEYISAGVTFDATITYDEELLSKTNMNLLLSKAGMVGVGAFRERFGKFVWLN